MGKISIKITKLSRKEKKMLKARLETTQKFLVKKLTMTGTINEKDALKIVEKYAMLITTTFDQMKGLVNSSYASANHRWNLVASIRRNKQSLINRLKEDLDLAYDCIENQQYLEKKSNLKAEIERKYPVIIKDFYFKSSTSTRIQAIEVLLKYVKTEITSSVKIKYLPRGSVIVGY